MENQNKIFQRRTLSCLYPTFSWSFFKDRDVLFACNIYFCHRPRGIIHTPFISCRTQSIEKKINIMTIMMKTIKKRLNLYTKYTLMSWGILFIFRMYLFSLLLQVPCNLHNTLAWRSKLSILTTSVLV